MNANETEVESHEKSSYLYIFCWIYTLYKTSEVSNCPICTICYLRRWVSILQMLRQELEIVSLILSPLYFRVHLFFYRLSLFHAFEVLPESNTREHLHFMKGFDIILLDPVYEPSTILGGSFDVYRGSLFLAPDRANSKVGQLWWFKQITRYQRLDRCLQLAKG